VGSRGAARRSPARLDRGRRVRGLPASRRVGRLGLRQHRPDGRRAGPRGPALHDREVADRGAGARCGGA